MQRYLRDPMFSHLDTILEYDTLTHDNGMYSDNIVLWGKNGSR